MPIRIDEICSAHFRDLAQSLGMGARGARGGRANCSSLAIVVSNKQSRPSSARSPQWARNVLWPRASSFQLIAIGRRRRDSRPPTRALIGPSRRTGQRSGARPLGRPLGRLLGRARRARARIRARVLIGRRPEGRRPLGAGRSDLAWHARQRTGRPDQPSAWRPECNYHIFCPILKFRAAQLAPLAPLAARPDGLAHDLRRFQAARPRPAERKLTALNYDVLRGAL